MKINYKNIPLSVREKIEADMLIYGDGYAEFFNGKWKHVKYEDVKLKYSEKGNLIKINW